MDNMGSHACDGAHREPLATPLLPNRHVACGGGALVLSHCPPKFTTPFQGFLGPRWDELASNSQGGRAGGSGSGGDARGALGDLGSCALVGGESRRREGEKGREEGPLPFGLFFLASFLLTELCH